MPPVRRPPVRLRSYILAFGAIALFLILAHGPLLLLPFYWDEAGQFIPASLDLFRTGAWIPVSTLPNVHPPGVMAYLAAWWSIFGFSIVATRVAMLLIAALGALVTFLLAIEMSRGANGTPAFAALVLLCLSPLFFAQSMLAQLDMPAMSLSILALLLFLQDRFRASAIACTVLVLIKETGAVAPALLGCWLLFERRQKNEAVQALWFLLPLPVLLLWLAALRYATGHWFGNPAFTEYNLWEPLHPARFFIAFLRRLYYLFIGSGHFIGTAALLWAFRRMPLLRSRPWRIAAAFALAHVLVVSALGGAVLERYLLPALPIMYIAFAVSLGALLPRTRQLTFGALLICLIAANFVNPLYPFPFENNLAFVSFVELQKTAADSIEVRDGTVATAFPMAEALRNPDLGFVGTPRDVITIADFTTPEIEKLKLHPPGMVVVFTRAWDPLHLLRHQFVKSFLASQYGYRPEMDPDAIADALSMQVAHQWTRRGLSFTLLTR
jgi:4-amino-4-deoxy-L-arabinose transferase-like glycosyltransferase